jgi:hypothetical protein
MGDRPEGFRWRRVSLAEVERVSIGSIQRLAGLVGQIDRINGVFGKIRTEAELCDYTAPASESTGTTTSARPAVACRCGKSTVTRYRHAEVE